MPKMKTHKGLLKRVKLTATGKVKHGHPGAGHLMSGKNGKRCRNLRMKGILKAAFTKRIIAALCGRRS